MTCFSAKTGILGASNTGKDMKRVIEGLIKHSLSALLFKTQKEIETNLHDCAQMFKKMENNPKPENEPHTHTQLDRRKQGNKKRVRGKKRKKKSLTLYLSHWSKIPSMTALT